ncbi:HTH-type transcriptional regulator BetI [Paraconexibacter sp. AEG42_29]|uniref:HTH-type transcriptional regulator BetI n=1 Tax=Paraconexibacter sp. AEG42_29 TaxID=2997339 RepID=A0AAU7AYW3_9ACTN
MTRSIRDPSARQRIITAGARAVAAHGVHAASVRVIAAEAGVSTGFITHYFTDKDELMEAVLEATNRQAAARVLRAARRDGTALERLGRAVDVMLPTDPLRRQEWQVWVAAWGEASKGDRLSDGYRAGWTGLRDIFAGLLAEAQRAGELDPAVDIEHRADRLVTLLAGIGLLAGVERPGRVRSAAERMLAEELAWLGELQPAR